MSGHERERLSAYLDGELRPGERAAVEAHLAACPECTALLGELAAASEAAAALPVEAPEGYFDTFPARVRARLRPRKAVSPVRRVPAWTWAAAAALLLAVITPLTLRRTHPTPGEVSWPAPPAAAPAPMKAEPKLALPSRTIEPQPTSAPSAAAPRARPLPPVATPSAAQAPAVAATPRARDEGGGGAFAREPAAPPPSSEFGLAAQEAPAGVVAGVPSVHSDAAADRGKAVRAAPGSEVAAEGASPTLAAVSAGPAAPAGVVGQEDAFRRLEAVRPRSAAGWRHLREQWKALAAAETDPVRADEARVRAIVAAREAWRAGGDEAVFRIDAAIYLRREDARQKPRVEGLLAEANPRPAP